MLKVSFFFNIIKVEQHNAKIFENNKISIFQKLEIAQDNSNVAILQPFYTPMPEENALGSSSSNSALQLIFLNFSHKL